MKRRDPHHELSISEPISTALKNGAVVTGTLWLHPSRRGSFEVEYNGVRKSDGRSDYADIAHIRGIARVILKELAEGSEK